jgi:hypothetical protein
VSAPPPLCARAQEYVFRRVDHLQSADGKLDTQELANGLQIMRNLVLGY